MHNNAHLRTLIHKITNKFSDSFNILTMIYSKNFISLFISSKKHSLLNYIAFHLMIPPVYSRDRVLPLWGGRRESRDRMYADGWWWLVEE